MKSYFLPLSIAILIGCGKDIDIDKTANNGKNSFIITFYSNKPHVGANNTYVTDMPEPNTFILNLGTTVSQPTSAPILIGYNFKGWYADEKAEKLYNFATPVKSDTRLYAKWVINTYSITFIPNKPETASNTIEITSIPKPSTQSVNHGIAFNEPTSTPKLLNYEFKGWFTEKETIHRYIFSTTPTRDIQLYAKWVKKIYKVAFYPNKPITAGNSIFVTNMPEPSTKKVSRKDTQTEPTTLPELEDYSFLGWFTDAETTNQYVFSTPIIKDTQLFAKWVKNDITITYIDNIPETLRSSLKVTNMPDPSTFKIPHETKIPIPTFSPKHDTFKFKGWFTQEEDGVPYDFNTPVKDNVTLYAQWMYLPRTKKELIAELGRKASIVGDSPDYNYIDTSLIEDMSYLFWHTTSFNGNISQWNVSKVKNMSFMFSYAYRFNQDLNNWNTSNVIDMSNMFQNAISFNQDLNNWNVSSVENMNKMFWGATSFNGNINNWNVSSVLNMTAMFYGARVFTSNLSSWDVSKVISHILMFIYADAMIEAHKPRFSN